MKEYLITNCDVPITRERHIAIRYYLLSEPVYENHGDMLCENFGIKIEATCDEDQDSIEKTNITTDRTHIESLLQLLIRNTVTPISLEDVLFDWL